MQNRKTFITLVTVLLVWNLSEQHLIMNDAGMTVEYNVIGDTSENLIMEAKYQGGYLSRLYLENNTQGQ